jgi:hypothetical protein
MAVYDTLKPTRLTDGVLVHDRGAKKGAVIEARAFYDETGAKNRQRWHKHRVDGRTARIFPRSIKAGGVELFVWIVVARASLKAVAP